jgi:glycosyltransferase involved in cell wall biosynthesis
MKIAINGFFAARPHTGSGQYLQQLWGALAALDPLPETPLDYTLFVPGTLPDEAAALFPPAPGFTVQACRLPPGVRGPFAQLWWEQQGLGAATRAAGANLLHSPYLAAPWRAALPVVTTIHDVIPWVIPGYRTERRVRAYLSLAAAGVRRSRLLLADSEASKRDAVRVLGVPAERVVVIYLAAPPALFTPPDPIAIGEMRARLGLLPHYAFYIGGFDRRKNVLLLIEAWARALPRLIEAAHLAGEPLPVLTLAGAVPPPGGVFPDVVGRARELGLLAGESAQGERDGAVRFLGPVSEADKRLLLAGARLFVFPSRYEGFGLDPLEAMAAGCPVISSTGGSLPEVVGDAALVLAPTDRAAWTEALVRLWTDPARRALLAARGRARAATFTPARFATQTRAAYLRALGPQDGALTVQS